MGVTPRYFADSCLSLRLVLPVVELLLADRFIGVSNKQAPGYSPSRPLFKPSI